MPIESHSFFIRSVVSPADLPKPGHAGSDADVVPSVCTVSLKLRHRDGSWTNQKHLTLQYVHQLRQFIQACVPEKFTNGRYSRIVRQLLFFFPFIPCRKVSSQKLGKESICAIAHRTKFKAPEKSSVPPHAMVRKDDRTAIGKPDHDHDCQHQRRHDHQQEQRKKLIDLHCEDFGNDLRKRCIALLHARSRRDESRHGRHDLLSKSLWLQVPAKRDICPIPQSLGQKLFELC